jgi:hypothetical protein
MMMMMMMMMMERERERVNQIIIIIIIFRFYRNLHTQHNIFMIYCIRIVEWREKEIDQ